LLGRVGGQFEGAAVCGAGLAGMAELTQEFGPAGVVQVVSMTAHIDAHQARP